MAEMVVFIGNWIMKIELVSHLKSPESFPIIYANSI